MRQAACYRVLGVLNDALIAQMAEFRDFTGYKLLLCWQFWIPRGKKVNFRGKNSLSCPGYKIIISVLDFGIFNGNLGC